MEDKLSRTIEDRLEDLEMAIFGNPRVNALGLMKRVSDIEEILKRWQRMEWMLAGALALMGLSSAANILAVAKALGLIV